MNVSLNVETAKSTEQHNDRSMYENGYDGRANNVHWDCYGCGSSFEAEARWYGEHFSGILAGQNQRALDMRKPERVMDMAAYHEKHMPKEAILQLGSVDDPPPDEQYLLDMLGLSPDYEGRTLIDEIRDAGGEVLSIDVHLDEATPHAHIRFAMLDEKGKVNYSGCLREHGIQPPNPGKKTSKYNNPGQTWLNRCRAMLEDAAEQYVDSIDRNRTSRKHEDVSAYKARRMRESLKQEVAELEQRRDDAQADAQLAVARTKKADDDATAAAARRDAADAQAQQIIAQAQQQAQDVLEQARKDAREEVEEAIKEERAELLRRQRSYDDLRHEAELAQQEAEAEKQRWKDAARPSATKLVKTTLDWLAGAMERLAPALFAPFRDFLAATTEGITVSEYITDRVLDQMEPEHARRDEMVAALTPEPQTQPSALERRLERELGL